MSAQTSCIDPGHDRRAGCRAGQIQRRKTFAELHKRVTEKLVHRSGETRMKSGQLDFWRLKTLVRLVQKKGAGQSTENLHWDWNNGRGTSWKSTGCARQDLLQVRIYHHADLERIECPKCGREIQYMGVRKRGRSLQQFLSVYPDPDSHSKCVERKSRLPDQAVELFHSR